MFRHSCQLRRTLACLVLIVYSAVGIVGYGLHELSHGHAHDVHADGGQLNAACHHASRTCCPGHHHTATPTRAHTAHDGDHGTHKQGTTYRQETGRQETGEQFATSIVAEHDCAICAFLAQAQSPLYDLVVVEAGASFDDEVVVSESIAPLYVPTDHLARGPPLG